MQQRVVMVTRHAQYEKTKTSNLLSRNLYVFTENVVLESTDALFTFHFTLSFSMSFSCLLLKN